MFCWAAAVQAQEPHILGTWKLNVEASRLPGPPPQVHVRRYSLAPDGTLVGLAVVVEANGRPNFLQFAAKTDGTMRILASKENIDRALMALYNMRISAYREN